MKKKTVIIFISILAIILLRNVNAQEDHSDCDHEIEKPVEIKKDEDADHDHSKHEKELKEDHEESGHDEHDEDGEDMHDEDEGDDHSGHDDDIEVTLTDKAVEIIGLSLAEVKKETLTKQIRLSGEVDFNHDRLVHLVPRFPGIAKKVNRRIGENVKANETVAVVESNESLSLFDVKSLISGTIVEKHITLGEFVSDSEPIYVIADLSKIWVNFAVYPKDISKIRIGQSVEIKAIGSKTETTGKISYIGKVFDKMTRFVTARVVLPNKKGEWRPGMFVSGIIEEKSEKKFPVVKNDAIQTMDQKKYVFVPETSKVFKAVEVKTGLSDNYNTQILNGLKIGDKYVEQGAFELKSKIVIENQGDPHAGHGH